MGRKYIQTAENLLKSDVCLIIINRINLKKNFYIDRLKLNQ